MFAKEHLAIVRLHKNLEDILENRWDTVAGCMILLAKLRVSVMQLWMQTWPSLVAQLVVQGDKLTTNLVRMVSD